MNTLWVCVFKIFLNNSPRVHSTTCIHDTLASNLYPALHDMLHDMYPRHLGFKLVPCTPRHTPRHPSTTLVPQDVPPRHASTTCFVKHPTTPFHDIADIHDVPPRHLNCFSHHDMHPRHGTHDNIPRLHPTVYSTTPLHDSQNIKPCCPR